jgi:hypothetical protein
MDIKFAFSPLLWEGKYSVAKRELGQRKKFIGPCRKSNFDLALPFYNTIE